MGEIHIQIWGIFILLSIAYPVMQYLDDILWNEK